MRRRSFLRSALMALGSVAIFRAQAVLYVSPSPVAIDPALAAAQAVMAAKLVRAMMGSTEVIGRLGVTASEAATKAERFREALDRAERAIVGSCVPLKVVGQ